MENTSQNCTGPYFFNKWRLRVVIKLVLSACDTKKREKPVKKTKKRGHNSSLDSVDLFFFF